MKAVVSHPVPRVNPANLSNCHRSLALALEGTVVQQVREGRVVQQVRATSLSMMVAMKMKKKSSFPKTMEARAVSSWDVNQ
jgi:hypothetical protein